MYRLVPLFQKYGGASVLSSQAMMKLEFRAGWICVHRGLACPFSEPSTSLRLLEYRMSDETDARSANGLGYQAYDIWLSDSRNVA